MNATGSYATAAGTPYAAIPTTFLVTGGTEHSTTVTSLQARSSYSYYVKCVDAAGVSNSADYVISFSVAPNSAMPETPTARLSPKSGSGTNATFVLQASDSKGYAAVQQASLMISDGNGPHTYYVDYWGPSEPFICGTIPGQALHRHQWEAPQCFITPNVP